ncbi:MAG: GGDEF domain-containing protein [Bdellovibrionales bacterium]
MHYNQNIEKSSEIASDALARIEKEGLAPTPHLFELWYVYYGSLNPEVVRAIDILESSQQKITQERCQELHQRFLSETTQNERVKKAGSKITETIKTVGGAVVSVKNATSNYSNALSNVSEKLSDENLDIEDARSVISDVMHNTQNMVEKNELLEKELNKSTEVMMELQRDLEMVKKEALTDGLTNLSNRKAFDAEIMRIREESEESGKSFSLIMMDIDHFKSFNDNYGHQVGDQVLRLVAKTLFDGVKGRDVVARYGGEEFSVILPETDLQGAIKVGDYLRKAVASKEIVNRASGTKLGRITLSGGAAEFATPESVDDLIERADSALYTAKHNGRNQISAARKAATKKA